MRDTAVVTTTMPPVQPCDGLVVGSADAHRAIGSIVQGTHAAAAAIAGCAADNDGPGFPVRYERR